MTADFGFTGDYYHAPSGLCLAQYREYSSGFGRWISRDPIGEKGGIDLYEYCNADPVDQEDPSGLLSDQDLANMLAEELLPSALNNPDCIRALHELASAITNAATQLMKYNPVTDLQGGVEIMRGGKPIGRKTVPGGHAESGNNALKRVKNAIDDVIRSCKDCKGKPMFSPETLNDMIQEAE